MWNLRSLLDDPGPREMPQIGSGSRNQPNLEATLGIGNFRVGTDKCWN